MNTQKGEGRCTVTTTTPEKLAAAYAGLYPSEGGTSSEVVRIFGNWLERYNRNPESAIATCNWCGKVTRALFAAVGIKQPKTKREMLKVLED
jgi:hypothetical protein